MACRFKLVVAAALLAWATSPLAMIAGGSAAPDSFVNQTSTPPTDVENNSIDINGTLFGFDEKVVTLTGNVFTEDFRLILSGTTAASHYIYFDPQSAQSIAGSVTFQFPIIGVFFTKAGLAGSSGLFGLDSVTYHSGGQTGLELAGDTFWITNNVLNVSWNSSGPGDHMRVLTAVPEPGTYAMLLAGLGLLGFIARRRMRG